MAIVRRSAQAHGAAPRTRSNGANIALIMGPTGKYPETLASPDPGVSGNHNPARKSRTKKKMLTIGPAVSWFGITVLAATTRDVKQAAPTTRAMTNAKM